MSEAEQNNPSRPGDIGRAGLAGQQGAPGRDADFDRLLEQLEAEDGSPAVSQIASQRQLLTPEQTGAFAPAQPVLAPAANAASRLMQPAQEPGGEFTRIFTQLPTPRSAPPAILAEVAAPLAVMQPAPPAPAPGEFTQFFRAQDGTTPAAGSQQTTRFAPSTEQSRPAASQGPAAASRAASEPAPMLAPQGPPARSDAFRPDPAPSLAPRNVAPGNAASPPPIPAADQPFVARPSITSAPTQPPAQGTATPGPGAFTAFFQGAAAPVEEPAREPMAKPAYDPLPDQPLQPSSQAPFRPAPQASFGSSVRESAAHPGASAGFTELLQSLGSQPTPSPATSAVVNAIPKPAAAFESFSPRPTPGPQAFASRAPQSDFAAPSFAPPNPGQAGQGEFTELMQSLQTAKEPSPALAAAQVPFFAAASSSPSGPSEYTRILQGSAARSAEVPVANFAPSPQPGGAAVGLPIAAPQPPKPALPVAEVKTRLQQMLPLLLAANFALLVLLVALAVIFLRHKH